ncbi:MAG TPA: class I SAM-dependent methyltransferase [Candidatus Nanoarchaeia archaeon]|nr:class I SAM-dependent methyltransferase [Candidatus Nanoarchaeia archaeon]
MADLNIFEAVYASPDAAPWTYTETPVEISDLLKRKMIVQPGRVLEVGCGEGYNAIFLAQKRFEVKAIDQSQNAIKFAKKNAESNSANVDFQIMDYQQLRDCQDQFDFIFDWRFFHEITDEQEREDYVRNISSLLNSGGKYLSVAFSGDSDFMGNGKLRISPIGKEIYFAKLDDSRQQIERYLRLVDSKHIIVPQKPDLKITANYVLAQK